MIGKRLKSAREASGFSLRDLENEIQKLVSAQAIGKYERDEMMPGSSVLLALAKALKVTPEYLLSAQEIGLCGIDFRKGASAARKEERAVEAMVLDHVERYLQIEDLVPGETQRWDVDCAFFIREVEGAEKAAEQLRQSWQLGIDPIPALAELLEEHGIKVVALDLPENVSGSKAIVNRAKHAQVPIVVVNRQQNGERQRFTLAHELAHLVLQFEENLSPTKQEKAADRFAGAFLMAKEMLMSLLGQKRTAMSWGELLGLKKLFKVSVAALVVRCRQLEIISQVVFQKLWSHINRANLNHQTTKEPNPIEREEPTRMKRLCFRAVTEGLIGEAKAAALLRISVRELDMLLTPEAAAVLA